MNAMTHNKIFYFIAAVGLAALVLMNMYLLFAAVVLNQQLIIVELFSSSSREVVLTMLGASSPIALMFFNSFLHSHANAFRLFCVMLTMWLALVLVSKLPLGLYDGTGFLYATIIGVAELLAAVIAYWAAGAGLALCSKQSGKPVYLK